MSLIAEIRCPEPAVTVLYRSRWSESDCLRKNNFDFVRFALASLVILSHAHPLTRGAGNYDILASWTQGQADFGSVAVNSFFVISGFLITHSWLRTRKVGAYLKKRALRIYPGFTVCVLFCALVVAPIASSHISDAFAPRQLRSLIPGIALLRGYNGVSMFVRNPLPEVLNGSLWSISYEFWCYIGVVLIGVCGLLQRRYWLLSLFIGSVVISLVFAKFHLTPGGKIFGRIFGYPPFWARLLPYFLAGMVFYTYREVIPDRPEIAALAILLLIVSSRLPYGMIWSMPLAGTYLLFWFVFSPALKLHGWAKFGDFSYGIYLYAFPIQQMLAMETGPNLTPLGHFWVAWPTSIFAGVMSWHLVEKRFLSRNKSVRQPGALEA